MRCMALFVVFSLSLTLRGAAADVVLQDEAEVRRWVEALDADRLSERTMAAEKLESYGPAVLPLLPSPGLVKSAAARETLIALRSRLERRQAQDSVAAATITRMSSGALVSHLAELSSSTGNPAIESPGASDKPFTVRWEKTPFWQAIAELEDTSGRRMTWHHETGRYQFALPLAGQASASASAITGPFRVDARLAGTKPLPNDPEHTLLRLETTWQAEPRLRPLFLRVRSEDWRGTVGTTAVHPWTEGAELELPFHEGMRQVVWPLDLVWPKTTSSLSWSWQGTGTVHLAAATAAILFDEEALQPGVLRRRGGVSVRLQRLLITPRADRTHDVTVRILVAYDTGGPAFESHRTWVLHQSAALETSTGERMAYTDSEVTLEADGGVGIEYRFQKVTGGPRSWRFRYDAPTLFIDVPVTVSFSQLPIPPRN